MVFSPPDFFPWTFVIRYFFLSRTFVSRMTFVFRTQFVSRTSFVPQMTCVHQRTFVPWSEFGPRRTFVDLNSVFRGFLFPKKTLAKLGWLLLAPEFSNLPTALQTFFFSSLRSRHVCTKPFYLNGMLPVPYFLLLPIMATTSMNAKYPRQAMILWKS